MGFFSKLFKKGTPIDDDFYEEMEEQSVNQPTTDKFNETFSKYNMKVDAQWIKGVVEKAVIPSIPYLNNFQKDHFVFPAERTILSYSIHFISKPT